MSHYDFEENPKILARTLMSTSRPQDRVQLLRKSCLVWVDITGKVLYHNFQPHMDIFPSGDLTFT